MKIFLTRFLRRPAYIVLALLTLLVVVVAVAGPWLAPYDPLDLHIKDKLSPPSIKYRLGTDSLGRDQFSRLIVATRTSVGIAVAVLLVSITFGGIFGAISGYFGGVVNEICMRIADIFLAFPALILALAITAVLGPNLRNAMIAISVSWWPWYARLVRGLTISVKENEYVLAAHALGAPIRRILFRHILPNLIAPVIVQATLDLGSALVTASSLSFIGMGVQPPAPEWGAMINEGRQYVFEAWWLGVFPGLAIVATVYLFNALGEAINETLARTPA